MGNALQTNAHGDPVTMVTDKSKTSSEWFFTGDIRVRIPSKRSVLSAYGQQRAPVKNKDDSDNRILIHDRYIGPTIIPTGHVSHESIESPMHKIFVSCEQLRGKYIGDLPALFRDKFNDIYEDLLCNNDDDFQPPKDLIDSLVA